MRWRGRAPACSGSAGREQLEAAARHVPDLNTELLNALIGALDAHTAMSTQALNPDVQRGLKDILLNHTALYERLRQSAAPEPE